MSSCWVLSSSSRPAGQTRAAGERRQAHGHQRVSQRHSPGSRGRKQDEAGCDEGQGCRRRQQQLPRQILKVFRSFQAAGDAPPPPCSIVIGIYALHSDSSLRTTLSSFVVSSHMPPLSSCFSKTNRNQGREGRAVAGHTCPSSTPAPPPPSLPALTRCSECAVSLRV